MTKKRSLLLSLGCLAMLIGLALVVLLLRGITAPGLPGQIILAVNLDRPVEETTVENPLTDLVGEAAISLRQLRDALVRASEDDRVRGVRLRIDRFAGGMAQAQEVRSLLARVSAADKWTAAYLDTAGEFAPGNLEYYVAAACDEISLNPLGDINLIGLAVRTPFLRGALDKLEVYPQFPGRGPYKTARFMYTRKTFTPDHKEMMEWLLDSFMDQLVTGIASDRDLDSGGVLGLIDQAPLLGEEAREAQLVDHMEDWTTFGERLKEREAGKARVVNVETYHDRTQASSGPRIAVVTAVGTMTRGESHRDLNPLLGGDALGAETVARAWRDVRRARGIKGAICRIDSPGGSPLAAEIMRQEMARTAEKMPVVVSMSDTAGSGGYWLACSGQWIVASPATLTGSIGTYAGHFDLSAFFEQIGVSFGRLDRGAHAGVYGSLDRWTESDPTIDRMLDRIYQTFTGQVAKARGMTPEEVEAVAQGRVFTGVQGFENGLVDQLGSFDDAVIKAMELADLDPEAGVTLVDFPRAKPWWQQFSQQRQPEESLAAISDSLNQWWQTGQATVPGAVWMPPIYVR